jgi:DNA-binding NarL/FixJ family response regulator
VRAMDTRDGSTSLRVIIVDAHSISRAACRALLRTEGIAVLADIDGDDGSPDAIGELAPDIVIVDVSDGSPRGFELARRIHGTPHPPRVVLTACDERAVPQARLDNLPFISKADICARSLRAVVLADP